MFTGIVEEIGKIESIKRSAASMSLTISAQGILEDAHIGDSISVNGVCLTITSFTSRAFTMDVMPETFMSTTLKELTNGSPVNLERAMSANGRFGGHFVTGHVDGVGIIKDIGEKENALYIGIEIPSELQHLFIHKGSVTVDGTSLTVFGVDDNKITISLIPQTRHDTILGNKRVGSNVNIECDVMAKYFHRFYELKNNPPEKKSSITTEMLSKNGFLD
jgi:riboflavin synthase